MLRHPDIAVSRDLIPADMLNVSRVLKVLSTSYQQSLSLKFMCRTD